MEEQFWQAYKDKNVIVFGIADNENINVVENFINHFKLTFPVLLDYSNLKNKYAIAGTHVSPYPRNFIIGRDGTIAYASDEYDPEEMLEIIENELQTSVSQRNSPVSHQKSVLMSAYPNPVHLSTLSGFGTKIQVEYQLYKYNNVTLIIYDITGRLVRILVKENQPPGTYITNWDCRNDNNLLVSSGIYFICLKVGGLKSINKITLIR